METAQGKFIMAYLYIGSPQQQIDFVDRTQGALQTVAPSYFDIVEGGKLQTNVSPEFVADMHSRGIRVTPLLSNHWVRQNGIDFLADYGQSAKAVADAVDRYDLDGVDVDIENVTHDQREAYSNFVKLLKQILPGKTISVAVAANPDGWNIGWHGSYDHARLAYNSDYIYLMAYDESYEGGPPGPVASLPWVERSILYALRNIPAKKLVLGVPFFGRLWNLDDSDITGLGVGIEYAQKLIDDYGGDITFDEEAVAPVASFTITANSPENRVNGQLLTPGRYVLWYENNRSLRQKLSLVHKYDLMGAGAWSLGQEDPEVWKYFAQWANGIDTSPPEGIMPPIAEPPEIPVAPGEDPSNPSTPIWPQPPNHNPRPPLPPKPQPPRPPLPPRPPRPPERPEPVEPDAPVGQLPPRPPLPKPEEPDETLPIWPKPPNHNPRPPLPKPPNVPVEPEAPVGQLPPRPPLPKPEEPDETTPIWPQPPNHNPRPPLPNPPNVPVEPETPVGQLPPRPRRSSGSQPATQDADRRYITPEAPVGQPGTTPEAPVGQLPGKSGYVEPDAPVGDLPNYHPSRPGFPPPFMAVGEIKNGRVAGASYLNVRSGPSTNYRVITRLQNGDSVRILEEQNGWYEIILQNGRVGYVSGEYIEVDRSGLNR